MQVLQSREELLENLLDFLELGYGARERGRRTRSQEVVAVAGVEGGALDELHEVVEAVRVSEGAVGFAE
jgi:hypothetical protein